MRRFLFTTAMRVQSMLADLFLLPPGYSLSPAPSVRRQVMDVHVKGRTITLEADHTTPLYDTIAEIVDYDCYQLNEIDINSTPDPIIIDIGANIGTFSVVVGSYFKGHIYAYEPLENNCAVLKKNIEANGLTNVTIMPYAVGCSDEDRELIVDPHWSVSARAPRYKSDKDAHKVNVHVRNFASILQECGDKDIALVKMDCEGCEYELLRNLTAHDARRIRAMTFEIHTETLNWRKGAQNRQVAAVIAMLEGLGFRTVYKPELFRRRELHHLLALR